MNTIFDVEEPWILLEDGFYSNGLMPNKSNKYLPSILFENIGFSGGTINTIISVIAEHKELWRIIANDPDRVGSLVDYLKFIDWNKNKSLYQKKFGSLCPKENSIIIESRVLKEDNGLYARDGYKIMLLSKDENGSFVSSSLFGERLEKVLDLPIYFNSKFFVHDYNNRMIQISESLQIGNLLNLIFSEIFVLTEGSPDINHSLKYLP